MARSVVDRAVIVRSKYVWPDVQVNFVTIILLATAGTILGISADFLNTEKTLELSVPWIIPYGITVGSLAVFLILIEMILIARLRLMPGMVMLFSFILFVLFLTGVIETGIQLFGEGGISSACTERVQANKYTGSTPDVAVMTLAWLEEWHICQSWDALFAFYIVGCVFLVWFMFMANQVRQNWYG